MQKLTNDKLSLNKDNEVINEKTNTSDKPKGTELLNRLIDSDKTVTITSGEIGSGNSVKPDSRTSKGKTEWENSVNGTGDNNTVNFDNTSNPDIKTINPKTGIVSGAKRPNQVGLGHELIHSNHIIDGDVSFKKISHTYEAENDVRTQTIINEELRTVGVKRVKKDDITENQLRIEQGQNERGAY